MLAAAGLAVLDAMLSRLGLGWWLIMFDVLHGTRYPLCWVLERQGPVWRQKNGSGAEADLSHTTMCLHCAKYLGKTVRKILGRLH